MIYYRIRNTKKNVFKINALIIKKKNIIFNFTSYNRL